MPFDNPCALLDTIRVEHTHRPALLATLAARRPYVRLYLRRVVLKCRLTSSNLTQDPIDSPGGYQILGKTLSPFRRWTETYEDHFLLRSFDTVRWMAVDEEAFKQLEFNFSRGDYQPKIEHINISFREIQALEDAQAAEVAELRRKGRAKLSEYGAMCVKLKLQPEEGDSD